MGETDGKEEADSVKARLKQKKKELKARNGVRRCLNKEDRNER